MSVNLRVVEARLSVFYLGKHLMFVRESLCVYVCLDVYVSFSLMLLHLRRRKHMCVFVS
jgi:hypothetical protein